jgi:hypothetical protein
MANRRIFQDTLPVAFYDIFNGDADGLCALQQLRLFEPRPATLVTGVKRDVELIRRVSPDSVDRLTVLDISLDANRAELERVLASGASCIWIDHHHAGTTPVTHAALQAIIDTSPDTCTSLIVNRLLKGRHAAWAVVGAFGDNQATSARHAAAALHLDDDSITKLRRLGQRLNYNAYGDSVDELHFHPVELFRRMSAHADPIRFMTEDDAFRRLDLGYVGDMEAALAIAPMRSGKEVCVVQLPDTAWARRASGELANHLVRTRNNQAISVLTPIEGGYRVSVRAPASSPTGADRLCLKFDTGGGRPAAAGINLLQESEMDRFLEAFQTAFTPS